MKHQDVKTLLADSDSEANSLLRHSLREMGFRDISVVGDGWRAMIALKKEPFDLLMADRSLPGIDLFEVARRLNAIPRFRKPRIIAMLDAASREDLERGVEAGIQGWLIKPFTGAVLKDQLQKALETRIPT
jgi:two-component system chemotaxis response regulator CheY